MLHMCKMIKCFLFFENFDFQGCYWGKREKNGPVDHIIKIFDTQAQ